MNKGLERARGDIIGILNADDWYVSDGVLERVQAAMSDPGVEACYGDLVYVKEDREDGAMARWGGTVNQGSSGSRERSIRRYWRAGEGNGRSFYWGWMPPHPTFFVRRRVYERYGGFRLDMGSAADYEFMLRVLLRHGLRAAYVPEVLVAMRAGGVSNATWRNRFRANRMDRRAWTVNGMRPYPGTVWLKPLRRLGQWWVKGRDLEI